MKFSFEEYQPGRKRYQMEGVGEEITAGVRLDVCRNRPRTPSETFNLNVQKSPKHESSL